MIFKITASILKLLKTMSKDTHNVHYRTEYTEE